MKHKNRLPNKIITRVMESTGYEINVSKLAEKMKRPIPSVWNKVAHMRRWDVETWLETLWVLGYARYVQSDVNGGQIVIRVPLSKHEIAKLDRLKSEEVFVPDDLQIEAKAP